MRIYYISEKKEKRNTAGAKAPSDIDAICKSSGYTELTMPYFPSKKNKIYKKLWLLCVGVYSWVKLTKKVENDSVIIYQHPMYGIRLIEKMVPIIQKKKNVKFIAVIHDLESLRGGIAGVIHRSQKTNDIADNKLLRSFDVLICHNEHMRQYLMEQGFPQGKLVNLDIFDYLSDSVVDGRKKGKKPSIAIAGNLAIGKCGYIYNICTEQQNIDLLVNLYGNNYKQERACANMIWHGSFEPDELPSVLTGDFGLVWDGNSTDTCAGNTGNYLRYNNPHKTSLYLTAGMPVIVWDQAAIANFVKAEHVGIAVKNLNDLQSVINGISEVEYAELLQNVQRVSVKLKAGDYFRTALEQALIICGYENTI